MMARWGYQNDGEIELWQSDDRSAETAKHISEKPVSIVLVRGVTPLAAQTVRIEADGSPMAETGSQMVRGETDVVILGYLNHPIVPDTNIQRGDRFVLSGRDFDVVDVVLSVPYRVIAKAKARV
jgi:hypothetical protein